MRTAELPASVASPRDARLVVAAELEQARWPRQVVEVAVLLTSELVTNAVRHAATTRVTLAVGLSATEVLVEVSDDDPAEPSLHSGDPGALSGRGIFLVDRLASSWGVSADGPGKTVWFTLQR